MGASPIWKLYRDKEYLAAVWNIKDALMCAAAMGKGTEVRRGHSAKAIVWRQGQESPEAQDSYDVALSVVGARLRVLQKEA